MTTATHTPAVCPGTGRPVTVYFGFLHDRPAAKCPVCAEVVQVYINKGRRCIGTHERREQ